MSENKNKKGTFRFLPVLMIVLIAADFIAMIVSLFTEKTDFFFYEGAVLVLLIVVSLAVVRHYRNSHDAEKTEE